MLMKRPVCFWTIVCAALFGLAGCAPQGHVAASQISLPGKGQGLVSVYLGTAGFCAENLSGRISDLELLTDGLWLPLEVAAADVELAQLENRQMLLGASPLPAGQYSRLRFRLAEPGKAPAEKGTSPGELISVSLARPLVFAESDSVCLFITWDQSDCRRIDGRIAPRFIVQPQDTRVAGERLYVVCDDINTLFLVRTDLNQVIGSMGFPGRLGEVRFAGRQNRVYLLGTEARAIFVIDAASHRRVDRIALPSLVKPRFMALSDDGNFAYVTDATTDRVVKVDLQKGVVDRDVKSGVRPERILFFNARGRLLLAVVSPGTQTVQVLDAGTLSTVMTLPVDSKPSGLAFDNGILYVSDRGNNTVTAFDVETSSKMARITVGFGPVAIARSTAGRMYIGNENSASLSLIASGQMTMQREIPIGPTPIDMVYFDRRQILYVANRNARFVTGLDVTAENKLAEIPLAGKPFALAVED